MGYTTYFSGQFDLDKPLTLAQTVYLTKFSETRRMRRNSEKTAERSDPARDAVKLPVGDEGGYFVGGGDFHGQESTPDVMEYNYPPSGQPGLWCQWTPTSDGTAIVWDGGEKFYDYVEWLEYIIQHFLAPWGYKLNGKVAWSGEESEDRGMIVVSNNVVVAQTDRISNALVDDPILVREVKKTAKSKACKVVLSRADGSLSCTCGRKTCRHLRDTTKEHILVALARAIDNGGL